MGVCTESHIPAACPVDVQPHAMNRILPGYFFSSDFRDLAEDSEGLKHSVSDDGVVSSCTRFPRTGYRMASHDAGTERGFVPLFQHVQDMYVQRGADDLVRSNGFWGLSGLDKALCRYCAAV